MGLLSTFGAATARAYGFTRSAIAQAVDAYFNRVTLLLPGNGTNGAQNNTFLDSSSNNFTITRNGNTTQGTFSPFSQTGWSNYFDGTDDYLSIADNAVLRPGTSNFTLEAWIWRGASGAAHTIYAKGGASTGIVFQVTSTNVLRFTHTTTNIDSTGTISANAWTHVAVVREGTGTNQTKLYINGTQDGQGTVSTDFTQTEEVRIGTNRGATDDFNGYISNLRFVKGTALYTGTFTPSTTPLTTTSQGATATEVELLTCQDNRFLDNSSNAFTITVNGTPSVQAFSPFAPTAAYSADTNGGSGRFDGSGDYLSTPSSSNLSFGTGDFTIEYWVYPTSGTNNGMFQVSDTAGGLKTSSSNSVACNIFTTNSITIYANDATHTTSTNKLPFNTWTHLAIVRASGVTKLYINGALETSIGTSGSITDTKNYTGTYFAVGGYYSTSYLWNGYISNFRVLKGTALYTTAFTPPTAPLTAITNTSLLLNFTNAGITDATAKNVLETVGNSQISTTQSKFGGSSMSFDGTGDWLTVIDNPNLQMGSGDFTIEGWFYLSATGVAYGIVSKGTSTTGWSVNITSGNKLQFSYTSSNLTGATTLSSATWYYFAVVRSGTATGNLKVYLNGSADATSAGAVTDNFNQTNIMYIGADRVGGSALNGYIDDLRITKGFARTITTPTSAFPVQ